MSATLVAVRRAVPSVPSVRVLRYLVSCAAALEAADDANDTRAAFTQVMKASDSSIKTAVKPKGISLFKKNTKSANTLFNSIDLNSKMTSKKPQEVEDPYESIFRAGNANDC